jgi:hypothetical protein
LPPARRTGVGGASNFRPANRKRRREPTKSIVNLLDMDYLIVIVTFGLIAGYALIIGRLLPKE